MVPLRVPGLSCPNTTCGVVPIGTSGVLLGYSSSSLTPVLSAVVDGLSSVDRSPSSPTLGALNRGRTRRDDRSGSGCALPVETWDSTSLHVRGDESGTGSGGGEPVPVKPGPPLPGGGPSTPASGCREIVKKGTCRGLSLSRAERKVSEKDGALCSLLYFSNVLITGSDLSHTPCYPTRSLFPRFSSYSPGLPRSVDHWD